MVGKRCTPGGLTLGGPAPGGGSVPDGGPALDGGPAPDGHALCDALLLAVPLLAAVLLLAVPAPNLEHNHGWSFFGKVGGEEMHWLMAFT